MAGDNTFQCSIITPEQKVLETDATFAAFTAHDGEMGVLTGRAPLVCKLGIGSLRIEAPREKHRMFIDGGFAQVLNNRLTVLTSQARHAADLDRSAAESALTDARAMQITDDASYIARDKAIKRAQAQLYLLGST